MTRSYRNRKNNGIAICRDHMKSEGRGKGQRKWANKKVRKYDDLTNGNMYKKIYCSWDIHDYKAVIKLPKDWHKRINDRTSKYNYKYFMCK